MAIARSREMLDQLIGLLGAQYYDGARQLGQPYQRVVKWVRTLSEGDQRRVFVNFFRQVHLSIDDLVAVWPELHGWEREVIGVVVLRRLQRACEDAHYERDDLVEFVTKCLGRDLTTKEWRQILSDVSTGEQYVDLQGCVYGRRLTNNQLSGYLIAIIDRWPGDGDGDESYLNTLSQLLPTTRRRRLTSVRMRRALTSGNLTRAQNLAEQLGRELIPTELAKARSSLGCSWLGCQYNSEPQEFLLLTELQRQPATLAEVTACTRTDYELLFGGQDAVKGWACMWLLAQLSVEDRRELLAEFEMPERAYQMKLGNLGCWWWMPALPPELQQEYCGGLVHNWIMPTPETEACCGGVKASVILAAIQLLPPDERKDYRLLMWNRCVDRPHSCPWVREAELIYHDLVHDPTPDPELMAMFR